MHKQDNEGVVNRFSYELTTGYASLCTRSFTFPHRQVDSRVNRPFAVLSMSRICRLMLTDLAVADH